MKPECIHPLAMNPDRMSDRNNYLTGSGREGNYFRLSSITRLIKSVFAALVGVVTVVTLNHSYLGKGISKRSKGLPLYEQMIFAFLMLLLLLSLNFLKSSIYSRFIHNPYIQPNLAC
ncbi:hypothetical protein V8F20_000695 [Naviculisporaceae sp. PSN 640]